MLQRPSLPHTPGPQPPASPPHNPYPHIPPLKPCKSLLPLPPHCLQVMTSASPLCHMQVHCHHPVTVCKTCHDTALKLSQHSMQAWLQCQPALWKPCHGATPTWHASPTTVCKPHHNPNLPCENLATSTQCSSPAMPTVTLPLNMSLDLGFDARDTTYRQETWILQVTCSGWSQGPTTLGHKTMVLTRVEKGREPLDLAE